jgi:hypothetical protein
LNFAIARNAGEKQQAIILGRPADSIRETVVDEGSPAAWLALRNPVRKGPWFLRGIAMLGVEGRERNLDIPAVEMHDVGVSRDGGPALRFRRDTAHLTKRMARARAGNQHDMMASANQFRRQPVDLTLSAATAWRARHPERPE